VSETAEVIVEKVPENQESLESIIREIKVEN